MNTALSGLLYITVQTVQAQVQNPSFESRNAVPSTRQNVGPYFPNGISTRYDDLQVWDAVPTHITSGLTGSNSVVTTYDNAGSYVSTDGIGDAAISNFGIVPHSGLSAVLLQQHDQNADHDYDQFVTQRLATPLLPGRSYQISFWVNRPQPSVQYHTKLAAYVTDSSPYYDLVTNSSTKYSLVPSPGSKVIVSDDIKTGQGWVLVSGFINIPSNERANQWLTIGYARSDQYADSHLPGGSSGGISCLIDDVSLTDTGCLALAQPDINLARQGTTTPPYSNLYDVRVNNVSGVTSFTLVAESPDGNGGWTSATTYQANTYTGPNDPNFNEEEGFTTFHTDFIGPTSSGTTSNTPNNNSATYRLTVTARTNCSSVTTQRVVTLPPYGGGYEESNLTSPTTAYPNPAAESISIPEGAAGATLVNDKGRAVGRRNSSGELDVRSLPAGLYNLQMMRNGKLINQRIQVKH